MLSMVEQILLNSTSSSSNGGGDQTTTTTDGSLDISRTVSADEKVRETELKHTWVPRFLKVGGMNKLNLMLETVL